MSESGESLIGENRFVFVSCEPRVPSCQNGVRLPSGLSTLRDDEMRVKLASTLTAKPPTPVVRAGVNAVGAMAKPSSDIMFWKAALFGRQRKSVGRGTDPGF